MTNFYWYISKRISSGKGFKKGFSRPIIHIATGAVALGIAVMLISIAIVIGFQNEVRDKVVGFGSHVQISQNSGAQSKACPRLPWTECRENRRGADRGGGPTG